MHLNPEFTLSRWAGIALVQLCAIAVMVYSLWHLYEILRDTFTGADLVRVNSGPLRILGCGLGLFILFSYVTMEGIGYFDKKKKNLERQFTIGILTALAMVVVLPILVQWPLEKRLLNDGYEICEPKTYTNRSYTVTVYTKHAPSCTNGLDVKDYGK